MEMKRTSFAFIIASFSFMCSVSADRRGEKRNEKKQAAENSAEPSLAVIKLYFKVVVAHTQAPYGIVILREEEIKLPCRVSLRSAGLLLASSSVEKISEEA
jgi:hypothetical protein